MKKIILAVLSGLFFLTLGWSLGDRYKNTEVSAETSDIKNEEHTTLLDEIDKLQKEIEYIKSSQNKEDKVITLKEEKATRDMELPGYSKAYSKTDISSETERAEAPLAKIITQLPKKYAEEAISEAWAIEQERNLQKTFAESTEFQDKELRSIKCKTSTCEIKFYAEDKASQLKIGSDIGRLIMSKYSGDFKANVMSTYSDSEKTASYYFSSNDD